MTNKMRTVETVIAELGKEKYSEMREKFIEEEGAIGSAEEVLAHFGLMEDSISIIGCFPTHHVEDIEPATSNREHEENKFAPKEIETRNNITTNKMTSEQMESLLGMNTDYTETKETTQSSDRPASAGQIKYYSDLCVQKGEEVNSELTLSSQIDPEIKRLKALPYYKPVSEKQAERITALCELMKLPVPDLTKLNGSYGGSASNLIVKLMEMSKNIVLPATENQIEMIKTMNFCPDFDKMESLDTVSSKQASEFISKNKTAFYAWKKTRLSSKQFEIIKSLTAKLGYELSYEQVIQFDTTLATNYIDQLNMELADPTLKETTLEPEDMYKVKTSDSEDARVALRTFVNTLYASIGQELEEEFYETMDWDGLKGLVDFVKVFGVNVQNIVNEADIFDANQKATLLA